jgi:RNA-directed DNA polymerase
MTQIKLTVNEEKTRVCRVPSETFDFLGYTFGRCYSPKTGRAYLGTRPSRKSIHRVLERLHAETDLRTGLLDTALIVQRLNQLLQGWAGYFCLGPVSKSYRALDRYTIRRLRRWLCHKHKVGSQGYTRLPRRVLLRSPGTCAAAAPYQDPSVGDRMRSCPRAGCGKSACPVR